MVIDIGGGTTEVAVISLGEIVLAESLRVGGYDLDDAITAYIRAEYRMAIGSRSAEEIKLAIGSASATGAEDVESSVRGRDLTSGLPREIRLTGPEVRAALEGPLAEIMRAVHVTLEQTPPELASDLARFGILLAGGGGLLRGLSERIAAETGMSVSVADDPLGCVALGAGAMLEELDALSSRNRSR
jgi:rod shape-determining protein MreB